MLKTYYFRIVVFLMLLFTSLSAMAQVNFKVEYDSIHATYTVFYRSDVTYSTQFSLTNSAQVTIELPDSEFIIDSFTPIDGAWNAPTIVSTQNRYFLVSSMVSHNTFEYAVGVEKPFFSFKNAGNCTGPLEIIDNDEPAFDNITVNIGNQMAILGFGRGNAFGGAYDAGSANCNESMSAPPTPTNCNFVPSVISNEPSCSTGMDGSIIITANSTSTNLQFSINNGISYQTFSNFSNLGNGSYNIQVKDLDDNCEVSSSINPVVFQVSNTCPVPELPVDTSCLFQYLLEEQNGSYTVSMMSTVTYTNPDDIVASIQISLRATTGQLSLSNIQDLQSISFAVSSQQINPSTASGFDYYSFSINGPGNLPVVAGQTIPLFSFENANNCATGNIQLIGDGDGLNPIIIPSVDINPQISISGFGAPDAPICVGSEVLSLINNCNADADADGDGVSNILEDQDGDGDFTNDDNDGDGTPNYLDEDDDNDLIPTLEEENAPNNGDGNGDGIADCLQDTVASQLAPTGAYRTLATGQNHPIFVYTIVPESVQSEADANYDYPYLLDAFIANATGTIDVKIYYHEVTDLTGLVYRKFGPLNPGNGTHVWYDYPHQLSTTSIGGATVGLAEFSLTDNQQGDADATIGRIVDPGGLAQPVTNSSCGVEYILSENNGIYEVSMLSNVTYTGSNNTIASMQVTLRAPTGILTVDDNCILDTYGSTSFAVSSVINPSETPGYDYFSFNLGESFSTEIPFVTGQTVPLFTFKNIGTCTSTEDLFLVGPEGAFAVPTLASNNVNSQLSTAGGGVDQAICVSDAGVSVACPNTTPPPATCGVEYILSENNGVYEVSMLSNVTYTGSNNTIASMQVTLRAPTGILTVDDNCILDTYGSTSFAVSSVINPSETPGYDYFSFNLGESFSTEIPFVTGQTVPLFSFKNIGTCTSTEDLFLVGPEGAFAVPTLASNNVNSQLSTAGGGVDQPICVSDMGVSVACVEDSNTPPPAVPCQVEYILEENNGLYEVKMLSNITWNNIERIISSLQVTLRSPTGLFHVENDCITPSFQGTIFEIGSTIINPQETPGFDYYSFNISSFATNIIPFEMGDTVSLFTFKNLIECSTQGSIYLVGEGATFPVPIIAGNNLPSQLFAAGGGGEDTPVCVNDSALPIVCPVVCPTIDVIALGTEPSCANDDGQILISADASEPMIYSIDGGATWSTSGLFSDLSAGSYMIEIAAIDTTCNQGGNILTLEAPAAPQITSVDATQPIICDGTGTIQILSSPASGLIYSVDGGLSWSINNLFTNLVAGSYDIAIAMADTSCITTSPTEFLSAPSSPNITDETISPPNGCGQDDGLINISTIPSTGLIYSIDGGTTWSTTTLFTGLGSGTFAISVANADTTCITNGSTNIFLNPGSPVILDVDSDNPTSCENANGLITINSSPASGVIYSIDGGTVWSTSNTFTDLDAGFYFVRVAYPDTSCIVIGPNLNLENPAVSVITSTSKADPTNCAGTNGEIQINSIPATGLIYSIDGGLTWSASSTFTNVSTGDYLVAIANPDTTCMVVDNIVSIDDVSNIIVSTINTDPSSPTAQDGCIQIITSCEDSFEYSNDGGLTWQTSNEFCDLGNGVYSVRVRCMDVSCAEFDGFEEEVNLNGNVNSCASIVAPVDNATLCDESSLPILFSIDAPIASYSITGGIVSDEEVLGNTLTFIAQLNGLINFYTITVTTTTGCDLVEEFVLYQAENTEADFVVVEPFCKDGEVTIQFTGTATPNAVLDWELDGGTLVNSSTASTTAPAGSLITVSWDSEGSKLIGLNIDDDGCMDDHVESIFVRKLPRVLTIGDTTICEGDCVNLEGDGTGVWYTWSPATGLSATDIPNPTACPTETTTYTLEVVGSDGCIATQAVTVFVEEVPITIATNVDICLGESAPISVGGGVTYQWSPTIALSDPTSPNPIANPTTTTTYMVTVTTANGCEASSGVTVNVHNPPTVQATGAAEICVGESTVLGAGTFDQYLWSPAAGLSSTTTATPAASPSSTTTYTVIVTDEFGCTATDQVTINVRPSPVVVPGPARTICRGQSVQISVAGTGTYSWSPTTNVLNPTSAMPVVMPEVTTVYTVIVTDAFGCTSTAAVTVNVEDLGVTAEVTSPLPLCPSEIAQLNATGGTTYSWSPTTGLSNPNIANPTANPTVSTEYCVRVTRADGCFDIQCVQVDLDDACTIPNCSITTSADVTICEGETTQLSVSEDANISTTYVWSPSTGLSNSNIANPIASPTQTTVYTVTGTTIEGCITTDIVTVFVMDKPRIITYKYKEVCQGDSIYLLVNGHASYAWNNTNTMLFSNTEAPLVFPATTTTYTVTVTGTMGCTATEDILVRVIEDCDAVLPPNPPTPNCQVSGGPNVTICQGQTMLLQGTGAVTYSWSPTVGLDNPNTSAPLASPDVTTTYTVTGIDAAGCISSAIVTVTVEGPRPFAVACEDKTICEGESIRLIVNNHAGYAWSPSATLTDANTGTPLASPTVTTNYIVTVTNQFGCTDTDDVTVFVEDCTGAPPPITDTDTDTEVSCTGITVNAGNVLATCPGEGIQLNVTGGVAYAWSPTVGLSNPNIANPIANPSTSTTYQVTVTDANGCTGTDDVRVLISLPIMPDIIVTDAACCGVGGGSIEVSASGGFGDISFEWSSTGFFGNNITNLNSGLYTVTLTDVQGCSVAQSLTVGKNCDTCTPLFSEDMTCLTEGTTLSEVCLPFVGDEINNYIISVDGEIVNTMQGCDFENVITYSYALVSSLNSNSNFRIDSWIVNGVAHSTEVMNISELTTWMNTIDPNGQWVLNTNSQTLTGGVSTTTYGDMDIVDLSSSNEATLKANVTGIAKGTLIQVDVSNGKDHQVIVENKLTCCIDELILSFCTQGQPCVSDMIAANLLELEVNNCNAMATFCIEIPTYDIDNYYISMDGSPYVNEITACSFDGTTDGSLLSLPTGFHELIFENRENGCQDRLLVDVACPSNIINDTSLIVGTIGVVCLADFLDTSTIVSVARTCLLEDSDILSIIEEEDFCWSFTGLAEGMDRFCIEVCTADGVCFDIIQVANVQPKPDSCPRIIQEAALSATIDDCTGEAEICVNIPFDDILEYRILLNGEPYRELMEACENGTIFRAGIGKHQLMLSHLENDCEYILDLKVNCQTSITELSETIELDEMGTFCPVADELMGTATSIINACPEESGTAVVVEMDEANFCINYTGIAVGTERICLVVCDDLEVCDTINYTLHVIEKPLLFPIALPDEDSTEVNRPITLRVIGNDSINGNLRIMEMVTEPQFGVARMNMDNTITYMPNTNYCELEEPESFMYRICNEDGCDSAYVTIRVPCLDLEVKTGFSPNGDGINDVFYIQGLQVYPENELKVFNRWGNLVFSQRGYKNLWSGDWNNEELPDGTYFYILTLEEGTEPMKGYLQINR